MHPRLNCDESKDLGSTVCVCIHVRKGGRVPLPRDQGTGEPLCTKQRNIDMTIISFILSFFFF
jgi:hypothetical protein